MCGVAGVIGRIEPGDLGRVTTASGALSHRGPDDEGLWSYAAPDGSFGAILAHRRLAIIDLDHAAAQPMSDAATGTTLVFNGEIYNFQDVRAELEGLGERFVTNGDSEVILRGYLRWGEAIVPRLRGMFAFVIVDPIAQTALVARDGLGIKPLYITQLRDAGGGVRAIAFASEGRALLRGGFARPVTDPARLYHFVWSGFSIGPGTIWSDVDEFPRGSHATLSASRREVRAERFWRPGRGAGRAGLSAADMLDESVRRHLVADVPKVVFLSGGIDSTALVGLARRYESDLETISLGFAEHDYDESRFAAQIAERAGTRHHSIRYSASEMLAAIDHSIAALDQPSFDGTNTWLVSRAAAQLGFKVGLSGAGGDELAGGYTSFRRLPRIARLLAGPAGALAPAAARLLSIVAPAQSTRRKVEDLVGAGGDLVRLYQTQYGLRSDGETRALLAEPPDGLCYGLSQGRMSELAEEIDGLPPVRAISLLESELFLGDRLLRDSDAVSMANSLELRVPFVDTWLFDGFDTLSEEERYLPLGSKPPLRAIAYATASRELIDRPKRGFELPIARWLRGELRETVAATLLDRETCRRIGLDPAQVAGVWNRFLQTDRVYWTRIWAIFVLLRWSAANGMVMG